MENVLKETNFEFLGKKKTGKVRDIYEQAKRLILVTTDRHSSFDRIIAHIPWKGQVLNEISAFWFEQTKDIVPNHVRAIPDPNVTAAKKCTMVPVEAVVRGYLTGVTGTSIWTRYSNGERTFGDLTLSDGLKKNTKLSSPVFDPTTKEDTHDRALSPEERIKEGLIDDIHTPDSSRYWQADSYDARLAAGEEPQYFDKEFLRLWFKDNCDPYKDAVLPEAPAELVEEMSRRYIQMFEQITGTPFVRGELPILPRMEKNLRNYAPS